MLSSRAQEKINRSEWRVSEGEGGSVKIKEGQTEEGRRNGFLSTYK